MCAIVKGSGYDDYPERVSSPRSIAFEHALDVGLAIIDVMDARGLAKENLAENMGISPEELDSLLDMQADTTLLDIARFEAAIGCRLSIRFDGRDEEDGCEEGRAQYPARDS